MHKKERKEAGLDCAQARAGRGCKRRAAGSTRQQMRKRAISNVSAGNIAASTERIAGSKGTVIIEMKEASPNSQEKLMKNSSGSSTKKPW